MNENENGGGLPAPGTGDALIARLRQALGDLFENLRGDTEAPAMPPWDQDEAERNLGRLPCPLHHPGAGHAAASLLFGQNLVPKPDDPRLESMIALMLARVFLETQSAPARLFLLLAGVIVHEDHTRRVSVEPPSEEKQARRQKGRIANLLSALPPEERAAILAQLEARAAQRDTGATGGERERELAEMLTPGT